MRTDDILVADLIAAIERADSKHGAHAEFPDGTGSRGDQESLLRARDQLAWCKQSGCWSWRAVVECEMREALAEKSLVRLRSELFDIAATCLRWARAIDARMDAEDVSEAAE